MDRYKFRFFYADWKSKLATISSHRFMGNPVGNVLKIIEPIETKLSRNGFGTSDVIVFQ
jgi:hypothetical protein